MTIWRMTCCELEIFYGNANVSILQVALLRSWDNLVFINRLKKIINLQGQPSVSLNEGKDALDNNQYCF